MTVTQQAPALAAREAALAELARLEGTRQQHATANAEARRAAEAQAAKAGDARLAAAEAWALRMRRIGEDLQLDAEVSRVEATLHASADPRISALRMTADALWERDRQRIDLGNGATVFSR